MFGKELDSNLDTAAGPILESRMGPLLLGLVPETMPHIMRHVGATGGIHVKFLPGKSHLYMEVTAFALKAVRDSQGQTKPGTE